MTDRREFLSTVPLSGVALAIGACATGITAGQAPAPSPPPPASKDGPWDAPYVYAGG